MVSKVALVAAAAALDSKKPFIHKNSKFSNRISMPASHFQFRRSTLSPILMGALFVPVFLVPVSAQETPSIVPTTEKAPVPAPVTDLNDLATTEAEPMIDSLQFDNIETSKLLSMLSTTFKLPITVAEDVVGRIKFINLSNQTAQQALRAVVKAGGLQIRMDEGVYYVSKKPLSDSASPSETTNNVLPDLAPAIRPFSNSGANSESPMNMVLPPLGSDENLLSNARANRLNDTAELVQSSRQTRVSRRPIRINNVKPAIMAYWLDPANNPKPIDLVTSDDRAKNYGPQNYGKSVLSASEQQGLSGIGNGIGGGLTSNFNPYLQGVAANDGLTETRANFQFGGGGRGGNQQGGRAGGRNGGALTLPQGVTSIVAIDQQNAILVTGTAAGIEELQSTIDFLDQPLKQVEIEAQFVSVTTSDSRAFGINFTAARGNFSVNNLNFEPAPGAGAGGFQIGFVRNNFQATLTALLNSNRAKVLTAPRVTAINNLTASLQSSRSQPIIISTVSQSIGGQQAQGQQPIYITTNIGLTVTPTINGDGTITVLMQPQLQSQQPSGLSIPIPVITSQTVNTIANVRDGETIALGGLKTKEISVGGSKIPLLSDIPFIGSLFKSRSANDSEAELIIFVTARIIHRAGDDNPIAGAD